MNLALPFQSDEMTEVKQSRPKECEDFDLNNPERPMIMLAVV